VDPRVRVTQATLTEARRTPFKVDGAGRPAFQRRASGIATDCGFGLGSRPLAAPACPAISKGCRADARELRRAPCDAS
jgi:hypothetical protein